MNKLLPAALALAGFALPSFAEWSAPEASPQAAVSAVESAWSSTLFGAGVKTNDSYTDGNVFLTIPLWSTIGSDGSLGGDYLFIEPYSSVGEGGEVAASLGLSYRHLFSREPVSALEKRGMASFLEEGWFVGGSLFVDMLDTQHGNNFWQLGVGAEVGSRYVELRGNYYIPLTGEKLAGRNVSTQSFTSLRTETTFGDPFATGHSIRQSVTSQTFATTKTIRTVREIFEKGMEGWDAELAVLVPRLDQWMDLKLIGGYFSFDNQPFGPEGFGTGHVHGWKAGVELRPVPAVVLSGFWYEDKRLTGGNWTVGAQLQIPLDKTWKDAFKPRRRHLVEHLAEPVHRQNDAIKIGHTKEEHSTASVTVRVVRRQNRIITINDSVIFVDADRLQQIADGTFEHPSASVGEGNVLAAQHFDATNKVWTVYVQSKTDGGAYNEGEIHATGSVRFVGSGAGGGIPALGGRRFGGLGPQPRVSGGFSASGIPFLEVRGLRIEDGADSSGVHAENVGSLIVRNNTFVSSLPNGVVIDATGSSQYGSTVSGNRFEGITGPSLIARCFGDSSLRLTVDANTFACDAFSITAMEAFTEENATLDVDIKNNVINGSQQAISLTAGSDTSHIKALVTANTISHSDGTAVSVGSFGHSVLEATITGNSISSVYSHVDAQSWGASRLAISVNDNRLDNSISDGMQMGANESSALSVNAGGNVITRSGGSGIHLEQGWIPVGASLHATINANSISNFAGDGISVFNLLGTDTITGTQNNFIGPPTGGNFRINFNGATPMVDFFFNNIHLTTPTDQP